MIIALSGLAGSGKDPEPNASDKKRFWEGVVKRGPSDCWLWARSTRNGYGRIHLGGRAGKSVSCHRLSFRLAHGYWPKKMVLHSTQCVSKLCCNPIHLREGTHTENMEDRDHAGATARGDRLAKKLSSKIVRDIRKQYASGAASHRQLGKKYGVSHTMIGFIVRGDWW